jgi:hypothetical protein
VLTAVFANCFSIIKVYFYKLIQTLYIRTEKNQDNTSILCWTKLMLCFLTFSAKIGKYYEREKLRLEHMYL